MITQSENIICPSCGASIEISKILYQQIHEQLHKEFLEKQNILQNKLDAERQELAKEKELLQAEQERFQEQFNQKLKEASAKIEEQVRKKIIAENEEYLKSLEIELAEKTEKVKEFNRLQAELERTKREKDEAVELAKLDVEKSFQDKIKQLQQHWKEQLEKQKNSLEQEKQELLKQQERLEEQFNQKLKDEKSKLQEEIKKKIAAENEEFVNSLQKELEEKSQKVKEFNRLQAELERTKREKDEAVELAKFEAEKAFHEQFKLKEQSLKQQIEEENYLKIKEKEKVIEDLHNQLREAQRKAEQGSMQLQGEIQELELEKLLKDAYPSDNIKEVGKGKQGGDVEHIVFNEKRLECGKIYYESKRTKNFNKEWIAKLKQDNLQAKADVLVIVSEAMPEGVKHFYYEDGVWICTFWDVKPLSNLLRYYLIQLHEVANIHQDKGTKMELLYKYLTSNEFKNQFGAILEGFKELKLGYEEEKLKMQKIWKEREKQLERILTNASGFYGSIKGIAGGQIPNIELLEG